METLLPGDTNAQSYSPQLKNVLKTYQLSATKSLQGPSSALLGMDCKGLLQEPTNFRFSPTNCSGTCGLDVVAVAEHLANIKDVEKKESSPITIVTPCKDPRLESLPEDSDDDPPNRPKVLIKRDSEFQIPILTAPDQSCSERCEAVLEGERISCFVVGGERRLCLPQILNTVLREFSLPQINQVCDELQIYCSQCTRDQLEELKQSGILPRNAPSCGLMTQTDAERLVSTLLSCKEPIYPVIHGDRDDIHEEKRRAAAALALDSKCNKNNKNNETETKGIKTSLSSESTSSSPTSNNDEDDDDKELTITRFKVYHECFGKCKGIFDADCFDSEDSACIECLECGCILPPQRFVRHAHGSQENRTCHWGFDSANWRSYLLLSRDQQHYTKIVSFFRELKERNLVPNSKRKLEIQHESERLIKKLKKDMSRDEFAGLYNGNTLTGLYHPVTAAAAATVAADPYLRMQWAVFELAAREASAFRPWNPAGSCKHRDNSPLVPAYLSRGPPVLQHPERVVPMSECERFEPHFQPNVALAPIPASVVVPPPPPVSAVTVTPTPLSLVSPPAIPVIPTTIVTSVPPHRSYHHHHHHHHRSARHSHNSGRPRSSSPDENGTTVLANATTTTALPPPPTLSSSVSPTQEAFAPVSIKIEKPSSPCPPAEPPAYVPISVLKCLTPPLQARISPDKSEAILATQPTVLARIEKNCLSTPDDRRREVTRTIGVKPILVDDNDTIHDDKKNRKKEETVKEEKMVAEVDRDDVTSSTATLTPTTIVKPGSSTSPDCCLKPTVVAVPESNLESELEEHLKAMDAPLEVIYLLRRLCTELSSLRIENQRLKNELGLQVKTETTMSTQQQQQQLGGNAADSTDSNSCKKLLDSEINKVQQKAKEQSNNASAGNLSTG